MSFRIRLSSLRGRASRSTSNHSFVHRPASIATAPNLYRHRASPGSTETSEVGSYFYQPFKEDELEQSTEVPIIFLAEPKPVFYEFDWELDELEVLNLFSNVYSFGYQIQLARGCIL
ncbi:hypothetical protein Fmac_018136 [Flemingia macrophylla]|uniref:Uncharacterized protein n=1 Tax=Flemingia macrophylla TaxID=520843 RepID=A0ABD1M432_9FABA